MKQLPVGGSVEVRLDYLTDDEVWVPAHVVDMLDSQFTAEVDTFGVQFFFYADKGESWRQPTE